MSTINNGVQLFNGAREVNVGGSSTINIWNSAGADFLSLLYQVITQDALHNANRKEFVVRCLPGTRTRIIEKVEQSLNDPKGKQFLWLRGPAGFGKTAIAQSICEKLLEDGRLGGEFFFSLVGGRTDHCKLFLTLAYRLAKTNSLLKTAIESVIKRDPDIINASVEDQFRHLVAGPLKNLATNDGTLPLVIVIDGLDECDGEDNQAKLLELITSVCGSEKLPIRFFIVSRPEPWIAHAFESINTLTTIHLEEDEAADEGIRLYYDTEFHKLRTGPKYRHLFSRTQEEWPSTKELEKLVRLTAGQFIFAATIVRCVAENGSGSNPKERLKVLLATESTFKSKSTPLDLLDNLYKLILSKSDDRQSTVTILGAIDGIVAAFDGVLKSHQIYKRECLDITELLLGLSEGDIHSKLYAVHSVAFIPESLSAARKGLKTNDYHKLLRQDQRRSFKFHHKSFIDFLRTEARSGIYFVAKSSSNQLLARQCSAFSQKSPPETRRIEVVTWVLSRQFFSFFLRGTGQAGNRELINIMSSWPWTIIYTHNGLWYSKPMPSIMSTWRFDPRPSKAKLLPSHVSDVFSIWFSDNRARIACCPHQDDLQVWLSQQQDASAIQKGLRKGLDKGAMIFGALGWVKTRNPMHNDLKEAGYMVTLF